MGGRAVLAVKPAALPNGADGALYNSLRVVR
jgi:hypothetical protein